MNPAMGIVGHSRVLGRDLRRHALGKARDQSAGFVARRPIDFDGCFGWLHGVGEGAGDVAVLLCGGLAWDALHAHHAMRLLADALARAGYPTLRFAYPGTGDSRDLDDQDDGDGDAWDVWRGSVHRAADRLKLASGARRVVFCGLRFGALPATLTAAARDDAAGLLLIAPVLRGHSYIRQLQVEAKLEVASGGAGLDFQELSLAADTVARIAALDLRQVTLPAGLPVAIFAQAPSNLVARCAALWGEQGARVDCRDFAGLEPMLRQNTQVEGPPPDYATVLGWLSGAVPAAAATMAVALPVTASLRLPGCVETPLRFGPQGTLFGMLCRPEHAAGDLAVVIVNTGRDPQFGIARFGVRFARTLARAGIASLRFDFAGLGDSIGAPGAEDLLSALFEAERGPDLSAALDALEDFGYRRFAVQGLCSGAYHAFHGAVADPRVSILLLVNMPLFVWRAGDSIDFVDHKQSTPSRYLLKLARLRVWRRALAGELDLAGILRAQIERAAVRAREAALLVAERLAPGDPRGVARRGMAVLSRRGTRTLFLFSPGDPGVDSIMQHFGRDGRRLAQFPGATMRFVPGLDHNLSTAAMQRQVAAIMLEALAGPPATPAVVQAAEAD